MKFSRKFFGSLQDHTGYLTFSINKPALSQEFVWLFCPNQTEIFLITTIHGLMKRSCILLYFHTVHACHKISCILLHLSKNCDTYCLQNITNYSCSEYLLFHAASYISIIRIAKGYHFKKRKGRKTREYAKALENLFLLYLTSYVDSNLGIAEKSLVYKPDF